MAKKKSSKKPQRKKGPIDSLIIEHLACLEINHLILQPPFHLVSNITWNDKGVSFDGDIEVYRTNEIKKENFIGKVPAQVKGTTKEKTISPQNKIKHSVDKKDLEVYYQNGQGVLYFVVKINPVTHARQAYYRILIPLELNSLLTQLNTSGNSSITLEFKKLEKGHLEKLCKTFLTEVEKQPKYYIENSKGKEFAEYKVNFIDVSKDSFNLFEETAYIYGVSPDSPDIPLHAGIISEVKGKKTETVILSGKPLDISYKIVNTKDNYQIIIEDTLTVEVDKKKSSGSLHLGRLQTIGSYLKCLELVKYYMEYSEFPLSSSKLKAKSLKRENFKDMEEEIKSYEDLLKVCQQIGIDQNYKFNEQEDLPSLFNSLIDVFKRKKYGLLNTHNEGELKNTKILHLKLSEYVKVRLIYEDDKFINFYSEEALETVGGLKLKTITQEQETEFPVKLPENWEELYHKVSFHSSQSVVEMEEDANFNFETIKLSFDEKYHDIEADQTVNASLNYIAHFDKTQDEKYLELARDLNQRYLEKYSEGHISSDIAKVNLFLIKLKQQHKLSDDEQNNILDIQRRAENNKNNMVQFACEVLLKGRMKAQRIFNSLDDEEKETMLDYPIYHFYETLD